MDVNLMQPLLAQAPPGPTPDPRAGTANFVLMMVVMVVMLYFVMIRPQQKKAKDHANLLQKLKPGDRILTTSGILGTVLTVKEKTLTVRSADAKFEITKAAIAEITERGGEASEA